MWTPRFCRGRLALLATFVAIVSCADEPVQIPPVGQQIDYELPPPVALKEAGLPTLSNGNPVLFVVPGLIVQVDVDRKNAITAVGACATWVMSCFEPAARTVDDCVRSVPSCATDQPWNEAPCCPAACKDAYADLRRTDVDPYPALNRVLFEDRTCVPCQTDLVGGEKTDRRSLVFGGVTGRSQTAA